MPLLLLQLKASKSFLIMLLFIFLGAFVGIFCSFLPYYIQLLLAMVVLIGGGRLIWEQGFLKGQNVIVALTCAADNSWLLKERSGKEYPAFLCGDTTRFAWMSLLRFKRLTESGTTEKWFSKKYNVIVFYDSVDLISYRRLQMRLGAVDNSTSPAKRIVNSP